MCGLTASFSRVADVAMSTTSAMMALAGHRGPDSTRSFALQAIGDLVDSPSKSTWAALSHARLAIVDLSDDSAQPMFSRCGRFALVFNGEIYNYRELRSELETLGSTFVSAGDTEVLLEAMIRWGTAALHRLRGMFALVFVDIEKRTAIAARDRYGIKPLYVWETDHQIHFASEIKQFVAHPRWRPQLDQQKAVEYLLYGVTDHEYRTLFQGVRHVEPGTYIQWSASRTAVSSSKWWHPERGCFTGSFDESVDRYRELFRESLSLHLRADVPIASCLSGGLDSSAIVGCLIHWFPRSGTTLHTFTAGSEEEKIDEVRYAQAVNNFSGTTGHFLLPTSNHLWDSLDLLTWHQDEPFSSTSIFAQWCVFQEISRHGIKVALDGQGADEQLGGYNSFINLKILSEAERGQILRSIRTLRSFSGSARIAPRALLAAIAYRYLPGGVKRAVGRIAGVASQNTSSWINPAAVAAVEPRDPFMSESRHPRTIRELSWDMVDRINLPMLLRFEDRNSMAFGVEARVPFVDHELMEFALTLPEDHLMADGLTKRVLRRATEDCLPEVVRMRRDKIGFQTNEQQWLNSSRSLILSDFDLLAERASGLFSSETRQVIEASLAPGAPYNGIPWRVTGFLRWLRVFDVCVK